MLVLAPEVDLSAYIGSGMDRTKWVIFSHPTEKGQFLLVRESEEDQIKSESPGLFPNLHSLSTIGVKALSDPLPFSQTERPNLSVYYRGEAQLPAWVAADPLVQQYLELFGPLDWDNFPERSPDRAWPGPTPLLRRIFAASFLIKIHEDRKYMTDLRKYLVSHPALVWLLGFELVPDELSPYGFNVDQSVPCKRHFSRVLRSFDNESLKFLFGDSVRLISDALPEDVDFGELVAGDTKHILAWVRENNPKETIRDRYDPDRQPKGDRDCELGVKSRSNQKKSKKKEKSANADGSQQTAEGANSTSQPANVVSVDSIPVIKQEPPKKQPQKAEKAASVTPTKQAVPASTVKPGTEYYWGYGTGVIATKVPIWGEFVLAEYTQTFNCSDIGYFFPLMEEAERHLERRPKNGAFDAAFDAFYTHDYFCQGGGFAAIPLTNRGGHAPRTFDENGLPKCEANFGMPMRSKFMNRTSAVHHQRGRFVCPLLYPEQIADECPANHEKWPKGGCVTTMGTSEGARRRYTLDRESEEYKNAYKQRTATERINSLAKELGIERPMLRNQMSITNQNTLIYLVLNMRAIQRIKAKKIQLAS